MLRFYVKLIFLARHVCLMCVCDSVALLKDGRFNKKFHGFLFGYIKPEAKLSNYIVG